MFSYKHKKIFVSTKLFVVKLFRYVLFIIVQILINLTIIIACLCAIRWLTPTMGSDRVYFLEDDRFYSKKQVHYADDERLNKERTKWAEEILKKVDLGRFKVKILRVKKLKTSGKFARFFKISKIFCGLKAAQK